MKLEVTDNERELLLELIKEKQKQLIQELDHTDSREYKALLRGRLGIVEALIAKATV